MATSAPSRQSPAWAQIAALGLSLLAVGIASYLTVAHYADPAALACPDTGIVNCAVGHDELMVRSPRCSPGSARPPVGPGHDGLVHSVGLAVARGVGRPRPARPGGGRRAHGPVPRLRRALPDRRHLLVVHGDARHRGVPLRGDPRRPGRHQGGGADPTRPRVTEAGPGPCFRPGLAGGLSTAGVCRAWNESSSLVRVEPTG